MRTCAATITLETPDTRGTLEQAKLGTEDNQKRMAETTDLHLGEETGERFPVHAFHAIQLPARQARQGEQTSPNLYACRGTRGERRWSESQLQTLVGLAIPSTTRAFLLLYYR